MDRRQFAIGVGSGSLIFGVGHLMVQAQRPPRIEMEVNVEPPVYGELTVFTLLKPNSTSAVINSFTDVNGNAVALFNLKRKDPSGLYLGKVAVTVGSQTITESGSVDV